jgi:hypothetical protein
VLGNEYQPTNPRAERIVPHAERLVRAVKQLDSTRPVTAALANLRMSNAVGLPELLDVVGYNYQEDRYGEDHSRFPDRVIYGSENDDAFGAWRAVVENDFISGQFLWTGIDYLGEAGRWPMRGNTSGLLDLATFRKPLGAWRQALWSDRPMVYLAASGRRGNGPNEGGFPRRGWEPREQWNWRDGSHVRVWCCTNCPEVDLYLNGKLVRTLTEDDDRRGWRPVDTQFQPGTLEAVGRDGETGLCRFALHTAGHARRVQLESDVTGLAADGHDVAHLVFTIVDEQGHRVPEAEDEVVFTVEGPLKILGIGNGRARGNEDYQDDRCQAWRGRGLAILQTQRRPGKAKVVVSADGLAPAETVLNVR